MRTLLRNALRELRRHWRYLIIAQATLLVIFPLFFLFIGRYNTFPQPATCISTSLTYLCPANNNTP